ncbi:Phosphotransferase enzyme [Monascus purpureus]|uniref:Phosphotransferase enzyme n=1 Tax=Monascus purpureus TaxID=5098 RepID=A0A507QIU7_MONPU|nr:Phosphotransferase enzyme [Monascus purpureus]
MGRAKSEQRAMWSDFPHNIIFPGINLPDDYSALLKKYLQIAPYEIDNPFDNPIIHHPDLTPSNVLMCPDTFEVKCTVNWQYTVITPLLLAGGRPRTLRTLIPLFQKN